MIQIVVEKNDMMVRNEMIYCQDVNQDYKIEFYGRTITQNAEK